MTETPKTVSATPARYAVSPCLEFLGGDAGMPVVCDTPFTEHLIRQLEPAVALPGLSALPFRCWAEADLYRQIDDVQALFPRYQAALGAALTPVSDMQVSEQHWRFVFGPFLMRVLAGLYDFYHNTAVGLDPERHSHRCLAPEHFHLPLDFEAAQRYLAHDPLATEQLFAVYNQVVLGGRYETLSAGPTPVALQPRVRDPRGELPCQDSAIGDDVSIRTVFRKLLAKRSPTLGLYQVYFSRSNFDRLVTASRGRANLVDFPAPPELSAAPDMARRDAVVAALPRDDDFERFVAEAFRHLLPQSALETHGQLMAHYRGALASYGDLRAIACEGWLGHSDSCHLLAAAHDAGIAHVNIEHNGLFYPWRMSATTSYRRIASDTLTTGWQPRGELADSHIQGNSLFHWGGDQPRAAQADLHTLLINGPCFGRDDFPGAGYIGPGAVKQIEFCRQVLDAMAPEQLGQLYFKDYPAHKVRRQLLWNDIDSYWPYIEKMGGYDPRPHPATSWMRRSRIVMLIYLATGYIEAMRLDIPTIGFCPPGLYHLKPEYADMLDELKAAGILQTDPRAAAAHHAAIAADPEDWWQAAATQAARRNFLARLFSPGDRTYQHLLQRAKSA